MRDKNFFDKMNSNSPQNPPEPTPEENPTQTTDPQPLAELVPKEQGLEPRLPEGDTPSPGILLGCHKTAFFEVNLRLLMVHQRNRFRIDIISSSTPTPAILYFQDKPHAAESFLSLIKLFDAIETNTQKSN